MVKPETTLANQLDKTYRTNPFFAATMARGITSNSPLRLLP